MHTLQNLISCNSFHPALCCVKTRKSITKLFFSLLFTRNIITSASCAIMFILHIQNAVSGNISLFLPGTLTLPSRPSLRQSLGTDLLPWRLALRTLRRPSYPPLAQMRLICCRFRPEAAIIFATDFKSILFKTRALKVGKFEFICA